MVSRIVGLALLLAALLVMPHQIFAAQYVVHTGDKLALIAQRYHVSVAALARANGITDPNLIRAGAVLNIPTPTTTFWYHVAWGDSLTGISAAHNVSIATIRGLNPSLGPYPLAGQWLKLCRGCTASAPAPAASSSTSGNTYVIRPGDSLSAIAVRYGVSQSALMAANGITNPDLIRIGETLTIPAAGSATYTAYAPWSAQSLIATYAQRYGIESSLPLAVAWQESGYNESVISPTGAVGVMQVEPYTGITISHLLGTTFNLYNLDDNIHAGVFWLAHLLWYYGGDERMAVAAYYQGTKSLAQVGFYSDTVQYVSNVFALKARVGG